MGPAGAAVRELRPRASPEVEAAGGVHAAQDAPRVPLPLAAWGNPLNSH